LVDTVQGSTAAVVCRRSPPLPKPGRCPPHLLLLAWSRKPLAVCWTR
jgi:hypothetical protein